MKIDFRWNYVYRFDVCSTKLNNRYMQPPTASDRLRKSNAAEQRLIYAVDDLLSYLFLALHTLHPTTKPKAELVLS